MALMRLLVVEDDANVLGILRKQLHQEGHEVRGAANGRLALTELQVLPADIVITDWRMPEMDGVELCRAIRADPSLRATYIIMFTGQGSDEEQREGIRAGANDYLTKPCRLDRLLASVRTAVQSINRPIGRA
jgi:DNA-binding response OmpR family regulator